MQSGILLLKPGNDRILRGDDTLQAGGDHIGLPDFPVGVFAPKGDRSLGQPLVAGVIESFPLANRAGIGRSHHLGQVDEGKSPLQALARALLGDGRLFRGGIGGGRVHAVV